MKSEMSKYVWQLKDQGKVPIVKWSIEKKAFNYKNGMRYCDLCATEKTCIALGDTTTILNKRTEIYRNTEVILQPTVDIA